MLVFQNRFLLGGQERQTVLNVLTMDRTRFEPVVACLHGGRRARRGPRRGGDPPGRLRRGRLACCGPQTALVVAPHRPLPAGARDRPRPRPGPLHEHPRHRSPRSSPASPSIVTRVDLNHSVVGYKRPVLALDLAPGRPGARERRSASATSPSARASSPTGSSWCATASTSRPSTAPRRAEPAAPAPEPGGIVVRSRTCTIR